MKVTITIERDYNDLVISHVGESQSLPLIGSFAQNALITTGIPLPNETYLKQERARIELLHDQFQDLISLLMRSGHCMDHDPCLICDVVKRYDDRWNNVEELKAAGIVKTVQPS